MFYLVILWLITMCILALDWYRLQVVFSLNWTGLNGGTSIQFDQSIWFAADNILSILVIIIADTLLVSLQVTNTDNLG